MNCHEYIYEQWSGYDIPVRHQDQKAFDSLVECPVNSNCGQDIKVIVDGLVMMYGCVGTSPPVPVMRQAVQSILVLWVS